jgi:hypothetical protein
LYLRVKQRVDLIVFLIFIIIAKSSCRISYRHIDYFTLSHMAPHNSKFQLYIIISIIFVSFEKYLPRYLGIHPIINWNHSNLVNFYLSWIKSGWIFKILTWTFWWVLKYLRPNFFDLFYYPLYSRLHGERKYSTTDSICNRRWILILKKTLAPLDTFLGK